MRRFDAFYVVPCRVLLNYYWTEMTGPVYWTCPRIAKDYVACPAAGAVSARWERRGRGDGGAAGPSSQPVLALADAGDIIGRAPLPESTIGGETTCIVCMARPKSTSPCRAATDRVRVRRLRGADAGLPLLPRTRPAVDARARGLSSEFRVLMSQKTRQTDRAKTYRVAPG